MRLPFRDDILEWLRPRADALVYASAAYVDMKSTMNDMASELIDFSKDPEDERDLALLDLLRFLLPREWDPSRLIRVGGDFDGGYVMDCDVNAQTALSIGVGLDVSWDQALAREGTRVVLFDHTVSGLPLRIPSAEFHQIGLGPKSERNLRTLDELIAIAGISMNERNILKIDVEGAEWEALANCDANVLAPFSQIVIELHNLHEVLDPRRSERVTNALKVLTQHHVPIHIHANNYGRLFRASAYWFVDTLEVLLVQVPDKASLPYAQILSSQLDAACDPRVSDISLDGVASAADVLRRMP